MLAVSNILKVKREAESRAALLCFAKALGSCFCLDAIDSPHSSLHQSQESMQIHLHHQDQWCLSIYPSNNQSEAAFNSDCSPKVISSFLELLARLNLRLGDAPDDPSAIRGDYCFKSNEQIGESFRLEADADKIQKLEDLYRNNLLAKQVQIQASLVILLKDPEQLSKPCSPYTTCLYLNKRFYIGTMEIRDTRARFKIVSKEIKMENDNYFPVELNLGAIGLEIGDLVNLEEGSEIEVDLPASLDVELCVAGSAVKSATASIVDNQLQLKLCQEK